MPGDTLAIEMAADLAKLFDEFPEGPTLDELTAYYGEARFEVHRAAKHLDREGDAVFAPVNGVMRLRPVSPIEASSVETPTEGIGTFDSIDAPARAQAELSDDQAAVLGALARASEDGVAAISLSRIAAASGVRVGNVFFVLGALEGAGKIEKLPPLPDLPGNQPNRYRLLDQDGAGPPLPAGETPRDVKSRLAAKRPGHNVIDNVMAGAREPKTYSAITPPPETERPSATPSQPTGVAEPYATLLAILDPQAMDTIELQAVWTLIQYLKRQERRVDKTVRKSAVSF